MNEALNTTTIIAAACERIFGGTWCDFQQDTVIPQCVVYILQQLGAPIGDFSFHYRPHSFVPHSSELQKLLLQNEPIQDTKQVVFNRAGEKAFAAAQSIYALRNAYFFGECPYEYSIKDIASLLIVTRTWSGCDLDTISSLMDGRLYRGPIRYLYDIFMKHNLV